MKSLTWLTSCILQESGILCSTETQRDRITILKRVEAEGVSFLTISLPNFCKDFERSLEEGRVSPSAFAGFAKDKALPRFLGGLLELCFDRRTGVLHEDPSEVAVLCIRQICLLHKKVLLDCSDARKAAAAEAYLACEQDLAQVLPIGEVDGDNEYCFVADYLWTSVLGSISHEIDSFALSPHHGPGSTADMVRGNAKYRAREWNAKSIPYFHPDAYAFVNENHLLDEDEGLASLTILEEGHERPVRVVFVPKTLKSPRVIALEPVTVQFQQQALEALTVKRLESHRLTSGLINFSNQGVNRFLALESSVTKKFATMDMSEASDRVLNWLVELTFRKVPSFLGALQACRTPTAQVPSGDVITLNKFASMGSAMCFPVEAMVFFTIILAARYKKHAPPGVLDVKLLKALIKDLYVYGDDIIIPSDEVEFASSQLARFGLKVNIHKTFSKGNFRESCGMDAFNGVNVTPVYNRRLPPTSIADTQALSSYTSLHNQLYSRGWFDTCEKIRNVFGWLDQIPTVPENTPCIGWVADGEIRGKLRYNRNLHRLEVRAPVVSPVYQKDLLTGWAALHKFFVSRPDPLASDTKHLERSVRSGRVSTKVRWVPVAFS